MKKNIILVLLATAAFSYLFYEQEPGINQLVFSIVLTTLFALNNPPMTHQPKWWLAAGAYLVTGVMTATNGGDFNILMNLGGMGLLMYVSAAAELSVITGGIYAFLSGVSGLFISLAQRVEQYVSVAPAGQEKTKTGYKWYYLLLPLLVFIIFFLLYRTASGSFSHLTNQVDLSFISPGWIFFTLFGFVFLFGFFSPPGLFNFFKRETQWSNNLSQNPRWMSRGFNFTGITLFIMLNLLLLFVDITDLVYLFVLGKEKMNMSYSEIIHQGIDALSVSVILAVLFILLWLNQLKDQENLVRHLKTAASVWVVLNMVLIATNVYKNYQYIDAHGLTYKRIGVFFFLTLALFTLVFCWIKINRSKTNFFMYRRFGLILLTACLVFNVFNWDKIIARYNITQYKHNTLAVDAEYMLSLSDDCIPLLIENWAVLNPATQPYLDNQLYTKCQSFIRHFEKLDWRSLSWNKYITYDYLQQHQHDIPKMKMQDEEVERYSYR